MRPFCVLFLLVGLPAPGVGQRPAATDRGALTPGTWALTNVSVITMTSERILPAATVVVRDGRIAAVGPARSVPVPAGATVIDGAGKYLIPGLADMHAHLYSDGDVPDAAGPAELGVMLANGITAVRLMAGTAEQLALRDRVRRGEIAGPQLWLASPMFANRPDANVRVIGSPEDARAAVGQMASAGYDFIKVTFGITGPVYDALVEEARRRKLPVVGHVEPELGVRRAIAAGQQLEHLDAFLEGALADSAPMRVSLTQFGVYQPKNWPSLDYLDDGKLAELIRLAARSGVWIGPTLEVFNRAFSIPLSDAELHALPDWNMIPPALRAPYVRSRDRYWAQPVTREQRARLATIRNRIVKQFVEAGGRILAGSDTPDLLMAYGFTLHRELAALVKAGLTPWQALAAATRHPAEYLGAMREWGTIETGKRADLVLLLGNPLDDIRNTQRIDGVMVGGKYLEAARLAEMIRAGALAIDGLAPPG